MKFRHFDTVISDDFEWVKLLSAINYYIDEMNIKGIDVSEVIAVKNKMIFNSQIIEKEVKAPF